MKLVIGLGNPGKDYDNTRHNAGYKVIDQMKKGNGYILLKSSEFMNDSGKFVLEKMKSYKANPNDLFVVHDDLDILLGEYKIQFAKGPRDHNGISSIDREIGTDQYWHVRVGVDKRDPQNRVLGAEYVLQKFDSQELALLDKTITEICKKLETILTNSN